jgi:phosphosulfolactate phosphohydrolase-like enzyme
MKINIIRGKPLHILKGLVVMIDVFRASSTLTSLCMMPIKKIIVAQDPPIKKHKGDCFFMDDNHPFRDNDNSPISALNVDLDNVERVYIISKNGTQISEFIKNADEFLFASFLNVKYVAEYIKRTTFEEINIIAIGNIRVPEETLEDNLCAEVLQKYLTNESIDYENINNEMMKRIEEIKFDPRSPQGVFVENDRKFCSSFNVFNVVPKAIVVNDLIEVSRCQK